MMNTSILSFSGHALSDIPTKTIKPWLLAIEALANQVCVDWSKGRHHSFKARIRAPPMLAVICGLPYEDSKLSHVILHAANATGLLPPFERPIEPPGQDTQRCSHCHPDDLVGSASVGTTTSPNAAPALLTSAAFHASTDEQTGYTCIHCTCCQLMLAHSVQINIWLAAALRTFRDSVPPALHGKTFAIYSWNVTGLQDMQTPIGKSKLRKIKFWLTKGIVCLQETKWSDEHAQQISNMWGTIQVVHTPAQSTEANGLTGGVAILIPTMLFGAAVSIDIPIPGFAIQANTCIRGAIRAFASVYLPPQQNRQRTMFNLLSRHYTKFPLPPESYLAGDFNNIIQLGDCYDTFLAKFGLIDLHDEPQAKHAQSMEHTRRMQLENSRPDSCQRPTRPYRPEGLAAQRPS